MTRSLAHLPPPPSPPTGSPPPPPSPPPPASLSQPRGAGRIRRWFGTIVRLMATGIGVAAAIAMDSAVVGVIVVLFVIVAPLEKLYPRRRGQRVRRPLVGTDIAFALLGPLLGAVSLAASVVIGIASLLWLPGLLLRPVVASLPTPLAAVMAFFVFDFLIYWAHRWAHEVPFLWRFHVVHHSPEHMDWISGFRNHPFDGVLLAPPVIFLLAAGFTIEVTGVLAAAQIILGIFFHANVRVRWRWLDKVACNPEFHHWHHANESDAIGHNYGGALPLWDLIFGTYFMPGNDRRPQHYGVDEPLPRHVVGLLTYPLRGGRKQLRWLRHPRRGIRRLFAGLRALVRAIIATSRRPTHSIRRQSADASFSTNASLFDPVDAPGVPPQAHA